MGENNKNKKIPKADIGGIIMVDDKGNEKRFPFEFPNYEDQPKEIYSNHVIINHTQTEFNLFFARINPIISQSQIPKGKGTKLDIVARITLPSQIISGLIKAFESNLKKFEGKK